MRMVKKHNKVAAITLLFWLMKIIATTLGETLGDFISMTLGLGYLLGIAITVALFVGMLLIQLNLRRFTPVVYWLVIICTTTLGTEISDFIDRSLHIGYTGGSIILILFLAVTLFIWYQKYHSLDVYPVKERQKEMFYWIAILFSNSLGTAFGDFLTDSIGFSYLQGAMVTGVIILIVIGLHHLTKINHILLFWIAFVFTRPFGATFGDFLTKPILKGGLELGTLNASLVTMVIMGVFIYVTHKRYLDQSASFTGRQ